MVCIDQFKTIATVAEATFSDKGSKFIGYAYPVRTEEEIKSILLELKSQHKKARHFCYAYRLNNGGLCKSNDDGEPAGSAGKPILNCLLSAELENITIVVVRYFDGKLLGVPGLINAYKTASLMALDKSNIIEDFNKIALHIAFDHLQMNDVMQIVKEENIEIYEQQFDLECELKFRVKKSLVFQIRA
ncbi:MAG: YigZ family protein, partial [Pedobacter sp.]|nr:YigZ family protein [Pedobacter sp.]